MAAMRAAPLDLFQTIADLVTEFCRDGDMPLQDRLKRSPSLTSELHRWLGFYSSDGKYLAEIYHLPFQFARKEKAEEVTRAAFREAFGGMLGEYDAKKCRELVLNVLKYGTTPGVFTKERLKRAERFFFALRNAVEEKLEARRASEASGEPRQGWPFPEPSLQSRFDEIFATEDS